MGIVRAEGYAGIMLQFVLSAGMHTLIEPMRFDDLVVASEVSIVGDEGAVIRLPFVSARR